MERRLTAILVADVVGYSRMMAEDEAGTYARWSNFRIKLAEPIVTKHNGRIAKLLGDGALIEFSSAIDAVECAIELQTVISKENRKSKSQEPLQLRIGINVGDLIIESDDIYGEGVNVASRLESMAEPASIYVSRAVFEYCDGKVGKNFEALGSRKVKNIPDPIDVYRVEIEPGSSTARLKTHTPRWLLLGAPAFVLLAAVYFLVQLADLSEWRFPWQTKTTAAATAPTLAVLPFENNSASTDEEYYVDGLTDDLITDLSNISGLLVISRNTVFAYKDAADNLTDIADELGAQFLLTGSVRRAGDRLRINVQLVDASSGRNLWAERLDRTTSEMFTAQDEVIQRIVDSLAIELTTGERTRIAKLPTENLEAYDKYLRAEEAVRSGFRPRLREALKFYSEATRIDPKFARAFAAQARLEASIMRLSYDDILVFPMARTLAYEHAGQALKIDPDAALPLTVLAELQTVDGQHVTAVNSARRAVEIAPGEAAAHSALSLALTFDGQHKEAISAFQAALHLDPRLPLNVRLTATMSYMLDGQPEKAVEILEAVRSMSSDVDDFNAILAAALALAGNAEEARKTVADTLRVGPNLSVELFRITLAHFRRSEDLDGILDALSLAGLPKWPWGFDPGSRRFLERAEIETIAFGRVWTGEFAQFGPAILQISENGTVALRTNSVFSTGVADVVGDRFCLQHESLLLARSFCGPVYFSEVSDYAYTVVNANMVFNFTPD